MEKYLIQYIYCIQFNTRTQYNWKIILFKNKKTQIKNAKL